MTLVVISREMRNLKRVHMKSAFVSLKSILLVGCFFIFKPCLAQNWDIDLLRSINPENPGSGIWKAATNSAYPISIATPLAIWTDAKLKHNKANEYRAYTIAGSIIIAASATEAMKIIFDRETSRMHFRTLGLAPLKEKDIAGQKAFIPMFYVYYPDARPFLAKHEAYNPRNMAMRMSWEEIFESRYYSSAIYKSTISNFGDKPLAFSIKDPMLRLFEGENIKEQVFNWEQDQWSY